MTNLTRAVAVCLRVLQADRALARRQVSASVAMILLAAPSDVYGLGLGVLLRNGPLQSSNRQSTNAPFAPASEKHFPDRRQTGTEPAPKKGAHFLLSGVWAARVRSGPWSRGQLFAGFQIHT